MAQKRERLVGRYWHYPVLNALIDALERWRERIRERYLSQSGSKQSSSLQTTIKNIEKMTWQDYKGRKRELVIEREVKS